MATTPRVTTPTSLRARFGQNQNSALNQRGVDTSTAESQRALSYKAYVVCHDQKILVEAWLPETVSSDVTANFEAPYAQGIGGDTKVGQIARLSGISLTTQPLTLLVWQGGSHIQFTLPFVFHAEDSAAGDVMRPIKQLLRLMMPREPVAGGLLEAPGPRVDLERLANNEKANIAKSIAGTTAAIGVEGAKQLANVTLGTSIDTNMKRKIDESVSTGSAAIVKSITNNISLYIGRFNYFPSVVIQDVSPTYDILNDESGNPIRASVNVNFKTYYIPTDRDIEEMFPAAREES